MTKTVANRIVAGLLTVCMIVGYIPAVSAAGEGGAREPVTLPEGATVTTVRSYDELKTAIDMANADKNNLYIIDIGADIYIPYDSMSKLLPSIEGKVQIIVSDPEGDYVIKRGEMGNTLNGTSFTNNKNFQSCLPHIFEVKKGASLTLGHGRLESDNTVTPYEGGKLTIDGGADYRLYRGSDKANLVPFEWTWDEPNNDFYVPDVESPSYNEGSKKNLHILYGEDGKQYMYANDGAYGGLYLILNDRGTLNMYDGVTLQNNASNSSAPHGGSAIYCTGTAYKAASNGNPEQPLENVYFNMYGGTVQNCSMIGGAGTSFGWGAVYVGAKGGGGGNLNNAKPSVDDPTYDEYDVGIFRMYGGSVNHNGVNGGGAGGGSSAQYSDAGGVALDQSALYMYGGEISYNRVGWRYGGLGSTSNGGGIHARCCSHIYMYGGSIDHNFSTSKGGGVSLWSSELVLDGGSITNNLARDGGGVSIAGAEGDNVHKANKEYSRLVMISGTISSNEARTASGDAAKGWSTGYGGGITAGTGDRPDGSVLYLSGGNITQNKAEYGGGLSIYAGQTTAIHMSGDATISGNSAYQAGDGLVLDNDDYIAAHNPKIFYDIRTSGKWPADYKNGSAAYDYHTLLTMSGNAKISTDNAIYFKDIVREWSDPNWEDGKVYRQIPVKVTDPLASSGVVGLLEFAPDFWDTSKMEDDPNTPAVKRTEIMATAKNGLDIIEFVGCPVQENKFALESATWYMHDDTPTAQKGDPGYHLELAKYADTTLYSYRNGTSIPLKVGGVTRDYYRLYEQLSDAVNEAASGDTIYVVYNSTVAQPVTIDAKGIKLVAENTSSAGIDAGSSGGSFGLRRPSADSDYYADGQFLLYKGAKVDDTSYSYESAAGGYDLGPYSYFIRNDYTVTISKYLYLGETASADPRPDNEKPLATSAIRIINGGALAIGEGAAAGSGRGSGLLAFDGNTSSVLEGSMIQVGDTTVLGANEKPKGSLEINVGVTIKNYTNRSKTHPGVIEVLESGSFVMDGGVITACVSPFAGAIYNRGSVTINDGEIKNNFGAMPRYGFVSEDGSGRLSSYDTAYWGQPKFYRGPGAVYSAGSFVMNGGVISGNRGEYGALVCAGEGTMDLRAGTVRDNVAWEGNGSARSADDDTYVGAYDLSINSYTEGSYPKMTEPYSKYDKDLMHSRGYDKLTPAEQAELDADMDKKIADGVEKPTESENAGCGGGVYAVGGTLLLGSGFVITGNTAKNNGGGIAVTLGTGPRRPITEYKAVSGGWANVINSSGTQVVVPAYEPVYSSQVVPPKASKVTVESWTTITGNTALNGNGGGVWVEDNGDRLHEDEDAYRTVNIQKDVILRDNHAPRGGGGGVAAEDGGRVYYSCEITGNSARIGGGIYVTGAAMVFSQDSDAKLTGNSAQEAGGGAYIDGHTDDDDVYSGEGGVLSFRGGQVSANRVAAGNGTGVGVYCNGILTVTRTAYINHADTVHLAKGSILAIDSQWRAWVQALDPTADISDAPVRNTRGDPITITSAEDENRTLIAQLFNGSRTAYTSTAQSSALLATGCLVHRTRPLAVREVAPGQTSKGEIEINFVSVAYYDRAVGRSDLDSHQALRTVTPGQSIVIGGFTVSESFVAPQGQTFSHWVKFRYNDGNVEYLDYKDEVVAAAGDAQKFYAGQEIEHLNTSFCLEAVYSDISYSVLVNVDNHGGAAPADANGRLNFTSGVAFDMYGSMTVGNNTEMTIVPSVPEHSPEAVLQSLVIYQELTIDEWEDQANYDDKPGYVITDYSGNMYTYGYLKGKYTYDYIKSYFRFWKLISEAVLEQQSITGLDGSPSGVIKSVQNADTSAGQQGKATKLDDANGLSFITNPRSIFVCATFKPGNVRLNMKNSATPYYYDSVDLALRGAAALKNDIPASDGVKASPDAATINLLSAAQFYTDALKPGVPQTVTLSCPTSIDLGKYTLDLSDVAVIDTNGCALSVSNGTLSAAAAGTDAMISASSGIVTLDGVTAVTDRSYSVKIIGSVELEVTPHSELGKVFVASGALPRVKILNTADLAVTTIATLCLDKWDYPTATRHLVDLTALGNDTIRAALRPAFSLCDADRTDCGGADEAARWFIGTDGMLYRRVAAVRPNETLVDNSDKSNPVDLLTGHSGSGPVTRTIGGNKYIFYHWYARSYGYDTKNSVLTMSAQVLDAYGAQLPLGETNAGSMSFYLSMVTDSSEERYVTTTEISAVGGSASITGGSASITGVSNFRLPNLSATKQPKSYSHSGDDPDTPDTFYTQTTVWSGAGQYAAEYADFWYYGSDVKEAVSGSLALTVLRKPLSDPSINITGLPLSTVEYIGPAGAAKGYTSCPGSTITYDNATGEQLYRGVEDDRYFVLLTTDPNQAVDKTKPLTGSGSVVYYYKNGVDGSGGGKVYFTDNGAGDKNGTSIENAKPLNGADVGVYSVELIALDGTNFSGVSGWKKCVFTITPYSGTLLVSGLNHVLVDTRITHPDDYYAKRILDKLLKNEGDKYEFAITVEDIYGNHLSADEVDFLFRPVSSTAELDSSGWPHTEGLYDLELRPRDNIDPTPGWPAAYNSAINPTIAENYSGMAAGYLTVLVTNSPLNVIIVPIEGNKVVVPYTGRIYNGADVKLYDALNPNAISGKYHTFLIAVDEEKEEADYKIELSAFDDLDVRTIIRNCGLVKKGADDKDMTCVERLLGPNDYTMEIGSSRNLPRNTGEYTIAIRDVSDRYVGSATLEISRTAIGSLRVLDLTDGKLVYTGRVQNPTLQAYDGLPTDPDDPDDPGTPLTYNLDYSLALRLGANTGVELLNVGTYTYTATGIGNYKDSVSANIEVVAKRLDNNDVEGIADADYDGPLAQNIVRLEMPDTLLEGETFAPALYYNGIQLDAADYSYAVTNYKGEPVTVTGVGHGTYTVTFTGKGNFQGELTRTLVIREAGKMILTNNRTYTYSGVNFAAYNWVSDATAKYKAGSGFENVDLSRCDINIYASDDEHFINPLYDPAVLDQTRQILDAGTYLVRVAPNSAYAAELHGLGVDTDDFFGVAVMQIARRTVKISVDYMQKNYGEADPVFLYRTNLVDQAPDGSVDSRPSGAATQSGTELYKVDKNRVTGRLARAAGEDAGTFYQYSLGSFAVEGDNYIFELDDTSRFTINRKSIAVPTGSEEDRFEVKWTATLPFTGYAINPINSIVYHADIGDIALAEGRDYSIGYEVWVGKTHEVEGETVPYTPDDVPAGVTEAAAAETYGSWEALPSTPSDVGSYRITINGAGGTVSPHNYREVRTIRFSIAESRKTLQLTVLGSDTVTYKAAAYAPLVEVMNDGFAISSSNYTLTYTFVPYGGGTPTTNLFISGGTDFVDAGTYTIFLAGRGNFNGSTGQTTFTILPKSVAADDDKDGTAPLDISVSTASYTYDGSQHKPGVSASYVGPAGSSDSVALEEGVDYTLSYSNHVNAGTATVTVVGMGNYSGSRSLTFQIDKMPVWVVVCGAEKEYGQSDPGLTYELYDNEGCADGKLELSTTGSVVWKPNDYNGNAHSYPILSTGTLSAGSNYDLKLKPRQTFEITTKQINDGDNTSALSKYMSASIPGYKAIGDGAKVSSILPTDADAPLRYWAPDSSVGQQTLKKGDDYELKVQTRIDGALADVADPDTAELIACEYVLTYTGKEGSNYTGTYVAVIKAVAVSNIITLTSDDDDYSSLVYTLEGHEVSFTAKNTSSEVVGGFTFSITANTFNGRNEAPALTVSEDKSTVTCTLMDAGVYTITAEGSSAFGAVTVAVNPKPLDHTSVIEVVDPFDYTGEAIKFDPDEPLIVDKKSDGTTPTGIKPSFKYGEKDILNYIVTYQNNVNPSVGDDKAVAHIFGVGNYTGSVDLKFVIGEIRYTASYELGAGVKKGSSTDDYPKDDPGYPVDPTLYHVGETVIAPALPADAVYPYGDGLNAVFIGWSSEQTTALVSSRPPDELIPAGGGIVMEDSPLKLYAVWATDDNKNKIADYREGRYGVIYHAGVTGDNVTGAAPSDVTTYMPASKVVIMGNTRNLAYTDYMLYGWCPDEPDEGGIVLKTGAEFTDFTTAHTVYIPGATMYMGTSDRDLYAVWVLDGNSNGTPDWLENDIVQVIFYSNGGVGQVPTPITSNLNARITLPAAHDSMARDGAVFLGWTREQTNGLVDSIVEHRDYEDGPVKSTDYMIGDDTVTGMLFVGGEYVVPSDWDVDTALEFHAVWAIDENRNRHEDYLDNWYTVSYYIEGEGVSLSEEVKAGLADVKVLDGLSVTLPGIIKGTHGTDTTVTLCYWVASEFAQPTDRVLDRYESALPKGVKLYLPGESVTVTDKMTFYPVWATEEYTKGYCAVNVQVVAETGGTVSVPGATTETYTNKPFTLNLPLGSSVTFTFKADTGFGFDAVYRSGVRVGFNEDATSEADYLKQTGNDTWVYTAKNLNGSTPILVSFAANPLNIQPVPDVVYTGETFAGYRTREVDNDGSKYLPLTITGKGGAEVTEGVDYDVTLQQAGLTLAADAKPDAGRYFIFVQGKSGSDYKESITSTPLVITAKSISKGSTDGAGEVSLTADASIDYTGGAIVPSITLGYNDMTLVEGKDYTVNFAKKSGDATTDVAGMVDVGSYVVTITGAGNYTGSRTFDFEITSGTLYTVVYNANTDAVQDDNNATLVTGSVPVDSGEYLKTAKIVVLGRNTLAADGAVFLGWTTKQDKSLVASAETLATVTLYGEGHLVNVNDMLSDMDEDRVLTLYALWAADANNNGTPDFSESFTVTTNAGEGGSIETDSKSTIPVPYNGKLEFKVSPNSGYLTVDVLVNGNPVTPYSENKYKIEGITSDQIITASFRKKIGNAPAYTVPYEKKTLADYNELEFYYTDQDGYKVDVAVGDITITQSGIAVAANDILGAGSYLLTLAADPPVSTTLTVTPRELKADMIVPGSIPASLTYTGETQTVKPVLTDLGGELKMDAEGVTGADYLFVSYRNGEVQPIEDVGVYTLIFTGRNNYAGSVTMTLEVGRSTLTVVPTADQSKLYGADEPALTYTLKDSDGKEVDAALDGSLTRDVGEAAGSYAIKLGSLFDSTGSYTLKLDSTTVYFTIEPKSIKDTLTDSASKIDVINRFTEENGVDMLVIPYTGSAIDPGLVMTYASQLMNTVGLVEGTDYKISYSAWQPETSSSSSVAELSSALDAGAVPTQAGYYTVEVTGDGNYADKFSFKLHVSTDDSLLSVSLSQTVGQYSGADYDWAKHLSMTVKRGGTEVDESDYDVTYMYIDDVTSAQSKVTEIVNVGVYEILVTPKSGSSYTGSGSAYFYVAPRDITDETNGVSAVIPVSKTYKGSAITQDTLTFYLQYGASPLEAGVDHTLVYQDNVNVGKARMVYTGMGNFSGVRVVEFDITAKPLAAGDVAITSPTSGYTYDGKVHDGRDVISIKLGGVELRENADYTLDYTGDLTNAGTVKVSVNFIGNYSGTLTDAITYMILPKDLADTNEVIAVVPQMSYTGTTLTPVPSVVYQPSNLLTFMLQEGTDYTAAYAHTDGGAGLIDRGAYTATITAKAGSNYTGLRVVPFNVVTGDPTLTVTVTPTSVVYTGSAITSPAVSVTDSTGTTLVLNKDYTLSYSGNENAGVATVYVNGTGSFSTYSGVATFVIEPKDLLDVDNVELVGNKIDDLLYNGAPQTPAIHLRYNFNLEENTDFTLAYRNSSDYAVAAPLAVGSYTAVITGVGNYKGVREVPFKVVDNRVTVAYNANGGTGVAPVDHGNPYFPDDEVTLMFASLSRSGAAFLGWSTTKHTIPLATTADQRNATIYAPGSVLKISGAVTLYAVWAIDANGNGIADYTETFTVTASANSGGSISPEGSTAVPYGDPISYTITVNAGYRFDSLTLDGKSVAIPYRNDDGTYTYTIPSVKSSMVVVALFASTAPSGGGGGGTVTIIKQEEIVKEVVKEEIVKEEVSKPYVPPAALLPWNPDMPRLIYEDHFAYMTGRTDGSFGVTDSITRAEVAAIFTRLILGSMYAPEVQGECPFDDVDPNKWYAPYITYLAQYGILKGYPDGSFRPDATITRGELCAVTLRFLLPDMYRGEVVFDDVVPGYWGYQHIYDAYCFGFITGYTDGTFRPDAPINRAEAVTILNRVLSRRADVAYEKAHRDELHSFTDLHPTHWAYLEIMEAANSHNYIWTDDGQEVWGIGD